MLFLQSTRQTIKNALCLLLGYNMGFSHQLTLFSPLPLNFNDLLDKNLSHERLHLCFILCLAYFTFLLLLYTPTLFSL